MDSAIDITFAVSPAAVASPAGETEAEESRPESVPMMQSQQGAMPMMNMMHERQVMLQEHMKKMETHMSKLAELLKQLVELQNK